MSLNIISGRAGSGKTTYIFKKIKEVVQEGKKKVYIITPEQFSFTAEKRLLDELSSGAVISAEVLTFSRMAYRVISGGEGGQNEASLLTRIESFGKTMLLYDILDKSKDELTFLGKNLQNVEILDRTITEFKKHNITSEILQKGEEDIDDKYLKAKLSDLRFDLFKVWGGNFR